MADKDLREELDEILALRAALDGQSGFLRGHNVHAALSETQISIIETLYEDCRKVVAGIKLPFKRSDDVVNLQPQIQYARDMIEHQALKLERKIETARVEPIPNDPVPSELTKAD